LYTDEHFKNVDIQVIQHTPETLLNPHFNGYSTNHKHTALITRIFTSPIKQRILTVPDFIFIVRPIRQWAQFPVAETLRTNARQQTVNLQHCGFE
jgi:hypothetical protein